MQEEIGLQKNVPFEFRGNGWDYFKVWIVNALLTLLTLGIYSPWAKVRNNQYIYANSYLGGSAFEYTANPLRILLGRLIVVGFYAIFFMALQFGYYAVAGIITGLFVLLLPLFIRQAIAFRLRYTRFHGLSFRFSATIGDFYKFFLLHLLLNILTLTIIFPYTHNEFKKLVFTNSSYGNVPFEYDGKASSFFFLYFVKMLLLSLALFFIICVILFTLGVLGAENEYGHPLSIYFIVITLFYTLMPLFYIGLFIASFILRGSFEAWLGQIVYNKTSIKEFKMTNEWSAFDLSLIYITNFLLIIVSLGFLYPYAKIRLTKYKLKNMGFESVSFEDFEGEAQRQRSALGEETADFFDFDIGF
ncbi:MAG: DUF898 domain-containing protein [Campylobacteraceae bacterium]|jgi:uncharacterized membrane protein YjgN (DUF898 family)|nr:DUF898 domain-containing protein [Campylobacteraceae bacterium]